MDNRNTPDKLARRIRKALRRASAASLAATTDNARKRHDRRVSECRKSLQRLDYDGHRIGFELA